MSYGALLAQMLGVEDGHVARGRLGLGVTCGRRLQVLSPIGKQPRARLEGGVKHVEAKVIRMLGAIEGESPEDGIVWLGCVRRIPRDHLEQFAEWDLSPRELDKMASRRPLADGREMEPVHHRPIECVRAFDPESGDEIALWRIPFRLVKEGAR
jgi:hypothetical protein